MTLPQRFSASHYNQLPSIEAADRSFSNSNGCEALIKVGSMILDYHLEDLIGVRLLHRHNRLDDFEVMVEQEEVDTNGRDCLSTRAIAKNESDCVANSWMLGSSGFEAVEFSTDPNVRLANAKGISNQFTKDIETVIDAQGVRNLLGLCIVPRSFYTKPRPKEHTILVETTDDARRANVVRFDCPENYIITTLVPTSWVFRRGEDIQTGGRVVMGCVRENCVPHTACVIIGGSHNEQTHHSSQHRQTP